MSWTLVPILDLLSVFYFVSSGCLTLVFHRITGVQSLKRVLQTCACSKKIANVWTRRLSGFGQSS